VRIDCTHGYVQSTIGLDFSNSCDFDYYLSSARKNVTISADDTPDILSWWSARGSIF
ncbi:hypothetical protein HAX54_031340, partial [Datura stramonium]|nr:hypothetical protein [Datura stramonium]